MRASPLAACACQRHNARATFRQLSYETSRRPAHASAPLGTAKPCSPSPNVRVPLPFTPVCPYTLLLSNVLSDVFPTHALIMLPSLPDFLTLAPSYSRLLGPRTLSHTFLRSFTSLRTFLSFCCNHHPSPSAAPHPGHLQPRYGLSLLACAVAWRCGSCNLAHSTAR